MLKGDRRANAESIIVDSVPRKSQKAFVLSGRSHPQAEGKHRRVVQDSEGSSLGVGGLGWSAHSGCHSRR